PSLSQAMESVRAVVSRTNLWRNIAECNASGDIRYLPEWLVAGRLLKKLINPYCRLGYVTSMQPLVFTLARIENLMHQVSFNPAEMKGKIRSDTARVKNEVLDETLAVFYDTNNSGLAVSPMIKVMEGKR